MDAVTWRKSSRSDAFNNGMAHCVETKLVWHKSSRSPESDCVEVAEIEVERA